MLTCIIREREPGRRQATDSDTIDRRVGRSEFARVGPPRRASPTVGSGGPSVASDLRPTLWNYGSESVGRRFFGRSARMRRALFIIVEAVGRFLETAQRIVAV